MKYKLEVISLRWLQEKPLRTALFKILDSDETRREIRSLYHKHVPDSAEMGPAANFIQMIDFAVGMNGPDALGLTICLSQIYEREGREWQKLANDLLDLYERLLHDCCRLRLVCCGDEVELFVEGHTSNDDGESKFVESGPKLIVHRIVKAPNDLSK